MYHKLTFNSFSFGCRVNEAERAEMDKQMTVAGFIRDTHSPDVYVINSCAVTAKAEREARQLILRLKKANPEMKLVVTGCSATYWENNGLWKNIPIDLIISNIDKEFAVQLLLKRFYPDRRGAAKASQPQASFGDKFLDSGRFMVKIQDGCHRFCTYCIVPYLRGAPVSRKTAEIVAAIHGCQDTMKEAVLTAINTEAFGRDTGETLEGLVEAVLASTTIARLSFGSIHPWSITASFTALYRKIAAEGRFSRFFHIPLQSGSDKTLSLMKRDYKRDDILAKAVELKQAASDTFLATDVIAGFLDETEADFEDTYRFFEKAPFSRLHVFRFSKRNNTAAFYLSRRLKEPTPAEKAKRSHALIKLSELKYGRFLESQIGKTDSALFIGTAGDGVQKALLTNQLPVMVPVAQSLSGRLKRVTITKLTNGQLVGTIIR